MTKVFIDGSSGTTGLRIRERLCNRKDMELIALDEACRKDAGARRDAFLKADVAFLCLPDAAAVEAVELAKDSGAVIIDTSTAHRTAAGWAYGMPELTGCKEKIKLLSQADLHNSRPPVFLFIKMHKDLIIMQKIT